MQGYQLTFMTEQNRRIDGRVAVEWAFGTFLRARRPAGSSRPGRDEAQAAALLQKIGQTSTRLFYMKTPIEYAFVGLEAKE
jgi:hypothetical protein